MAVEELQTRVGPIYLIRSEDAFRIAYVRGAVGTIGNLRDPAHFLREALAGNRFRLETNGATLSLGSDEEGTIHLTQCVPMEWVNDSALLEVTLQPFCAALVRWRERLALEARLPDEQEGVVR